jgi:hypothetical protein
LATGPWGLNRTAELLLHDIPDGGAGIPGNQRPDWLSEPLALPPIGIESGQMHGDGHHASLAILGTGCEEGDMLGVEWAAERAGFWIEGEQPAALLA